MKSPPQKIGDHRARLRADAAGPWARSPRVLRLCPAFEAPPASLDGDDLALFDAVGGMQNHAGRLSRALDRRGIAQTIVTTRPPRAAARERFGDHGEVLRLGCRLLRLRRLYSLPAARLVPRLAAHADLVHVHQGEDLAALPIALAAARRHRLPLVVTVHCSLSHTLARTDARSMLLGTLGAGVERRALRCAHAAICLTRRLARRLAGDGVAEERLRVIPSGVEPADFRGPFDDPFPELPRPRVLFVGRLAPQKGVATLIEAAARLGDRAAAVVLVGDGPDRPDLERRARELGVAGRVTFTGLVPPGRVPAVLAHGDVLVLPSVYEELGSVLLEGMQAGLPIVASRTGGIPEAVEDGGNGLLVEPGDPGALAGAIRRVLDSPDLASRLGAVSKKRAGRYHWDRLSGEVLDVYRSALAARASLRPAARAGFRFDPAGSR